MNKSNMAARVQFSSEPLTSWESEPCATLVLQTGFNREKEEVFEGSVIGRIIESAVTT